MFKFQMVVPMLYVDEMPSVQYLHISLFATARLILLETRTIEMLVVNQDVSYLHFFY